METPTLHHAPQAYRPLAPANVLVGVDGDRGGRDAIALAEALRDPRGAITFAHVVLSQAPTFRNFRSTAAWRAAREMLERERKLAGIDAKLTGMASHSVGSGLQQLVEDCGADLLVVGSCRHGLLWRLVRGDPTRAALRSASCAVAVAPPGYAQRACH